MKRVVKAWLKVDGQRGVAHILIEDQSVKYLIVWSLSPQEEPLAEKWLELDRSKLLPLRDDDWCEYMYDHPISLAEIQGAQQADTSTESELRG